MALKPATDFKADAPYAYIAVQTEPKNDGIGPDAQQKADANGVPQWTIDLLRTDPEGPSSILSVTVSSSEQPEVMGPVNVRGLRVGHYQVAGRDGRSGKSGLFWQADAVVQAGGKA